MNQSSCIIIMIVVVVVVVAYFTMGQLEGFSNSPNNGYTATHVILIMWCCLIFAIFSMSSLPQVNVLVA